MNMLRWAALGNLPAFLSLATVALAQSAGSIQATGTAAIHVAPDQAQLTAGVVTNAATAQDAAERNASQTAAMLAALKAVLGTNGTLQTIGYSVTPRYSNVQTPVITGYSASNTIQVTTNNLNLAGPLIDAANQAGANNVSGISFSLQDPDPVLQQALAKAAKQAQLHAGAIASGLGAKTGNVISAQEVASVVPYREGLPTTATATPVVTGTVSVNATVTVSVQLLQ